MRSGFIIALLKTIVLKQIEKRKAGQFFFLMARIKNFSHPEIQGTQLLNTHIVLL